MMHDETSTLDDADAYGAESAQDHDPLFWQVTAGPQAGGAVVVVVDLGWDDAGRNAGRRAPYRRRRLCQCGRLLSLDAGRQRQPVARLVRRAAASVRVRLPGAHGRGLVLSRLAHRAGPGGLEHVYCLRHTAWAPQDQTRRARNSARTRSYCEAVHIKTNPGMPVTPEILANVPGDGLKLSGIRPGHDRAVVLEWPAPNMETALAQLTKAKAEGVRALTLSENGVGVELASFTAAQLQLLLQVDHYYGSDIMLSDVLARAGLVTR